MTNYLAIAYKFIGKELKSLNLYHLFIKEFNKIKYLINLDEPNGNATLEVLELALNNMHRENYHNTVLAMHISDLLSKYNRLVNYLCLMLADDFLKSDSLIKTQFLNNLSNSDFRHRKTKPLDYYHFLQQNSMGLAFISSSFPWARSNEGYEYWYNLDRKFRSLEKFW